jgi:single-strand DNA-binding protein
VVEVLPSITGEFGIVADPEAKFSQKGNLWVKMRVVAKDRKRDSTGQWTDGDPCFLDAVAFGAVAENVVESVQKGDSLVLTGRLSMSEWTTDEGQKRQSYQIQVDSVGLSLRWKAAMVKETGREAVQRSMPGPAQSTAETAPPF